MASIKLPQLAWYGTKDMELPLPEGWSTRFYNMAGADRPVMTPQAMKAAITNTIGSPPIRELARGKKEVVIIFDDMTRVTRTYEILPIILEELAAAGVTDDRIQLICALGAHMAWDRTLFVKKLGKDIMGRFPVYNHNAFGNCTYVGTTSYETPIYVNEEVMRCDLKIGIGAVVPHPNAGFGGGGKIILPGVSSIETITSFHRVEKQYKEQHPGRQDIGPGLFDNNPMRLNIAEAAALAGLDIKIDCLLNTRGETVGIFAGALEPAYAAAVAEAKQHCLTPRLDGEEIYIANTFAKANEALMVGMRVPFVASSSNDVDIVLTSNAPDGQVTHYLLGNFGKTVAGEQKLVIKIPDHVKRLIVYTEYPDLAGQGYVEKSDRVVYVHKWDDVLDILKQRHGDTARVAVYPCAEIQYSAYE
ncbi:lactate racemase domain-containing protein [Chloroflexota bacterium]